jgi:GNAT superfamily N-acetyltransferase
VGAALVGAVVAWAAAAGRPTYLMVRSDNARAIAAYVRAGFVDLGIPPGHPPNEPPENRMVHRPARSSIGHKPQGMRSHTCGS